MKAGISRVEDLANGVEALSLAAVGAKTVYYCDGNAGVDTNSGVGGWENSFKTLTVALAASQADISLNKYGWAARNVIFCRGDAFTENLVLLAQKTDVIGLGHWDRFPLCGLIGNHVPTAAANAGLGTRFFNFHFRAAAAGGDIWTLDSTVAGLSFINCRFDSMSSTTATAAIVATASTDLVIQGCEFPGKWSDSTIEIAAGDAFGLRILDNYVEGATDGIELNSAVTDSAGVTERYMLIKDNVVVSVDIGINDASGLAYVIGNRVITENAQGTAGAGAIVAGAKRMLDNRISASDVANAVVPAEGSLA